MNLTWLDFLAIGVPFAVIAVVSVLLKRYTRSVADFLAASRCAGRYLISVSGGAMGASVAAVCMTLEVFSKTGFSIQFWTNLNTALFLFLGLFGLITYRFRETHSLTFHQFFEVRYSKGVRIFASGLQVFSSLLSFGWIPAVGSRFLVYFCGLPPVWHFWVPGLGEFAMATFIPLMIVLMATSLVFSLTGGHISVMITDCLEGVISSFFFLVVAGFILCTLSFSQMRTAMLSGPPGMSFVDPLDIGNQKDLNGWYIVFTLVVGVLIFRGSTWYQAFAASAKNAHESRMATVLSGWRVYSQLAMIVLVSIGALTLLNHPDFHAQRVLVDQGLQGVDKQLQSQLRMPMALGLLLAPGVRGCFLAVLLFGLLAGQGAHLHSFGATILQDVLLPARKKPFSPKAHVFWLRFTMIAVAVFLCTFSILFKPMDYMVMITMLLGSIYLGGVGMVVWGGLYWKKGTTAAAWTALILGASLGLLCNFVRQCWTWLATGLAGLLEAGPAKSYLLEHQGSCPLNGTEMAFGIAVTCATTYVIVSLLTCRQEFNMDAMLHRGKYRLPESETAVAPFKRSFWDRIFNINENFNRFDRFLTIGTFGWSIFWYVVALGTILWALFISRPSPSWWFEYHMITSVWVTVCAAVVCTVWFTIGVTRDMLDLFRGLNTVRRSDADDGMVRNHHNADEKDPAAPATGPAAPAEEKSAANVG